MFVLDFIYLLMVIYGSLCLEDYLTLFLFIFGLMELFTFFEKLVLWEKPPTQNLGI